MYRNQICHQSFNAWDAAADLHAEYHHVTNQSLHLFTLVWICLFLCGRYKYAPWWFFLKFPVEYTAKRGYFYMLRILDVLKELQDEKKYI